MGGLKVSLAGILVMFIFFAAGSILGQEYMLVLNEGRFFSSEFKNLETRVKNAEALIAKEKQGEAITKYEEILNDFPDHLKSWNRLADLYSWNNMNDKSIQCYEKIIQLNPMDNKTKSKLAQQYIWNNRQLEAIDLLEKVLVLEPGNLAVHRQLADLYIWNYMPNKAIRQFEEIIKFDSTDTQTMKNLANNYFWLERPWDGIKILEKVVELEPDSIGLRKLLAQQYVWNEMPKETIVQYEEILKRDNTEKEIKEKLAQQYMWNNQPEKAATLYTEFSSREPNNEFYKMQLARAFLWSNQGEKARQPLQEILHNKPYHTEALLSLAELQRWSGQWDEAKTKLHKLKQLDPKNERGKILLAGIRDQYGTLAEGRYNRISDSNKLERVEMPLGTTCYLNRFWEYSMNAARYVIKDGRMDSTLVGYRARLSTRHNFSNSTATKFELTATNYSSNWNSFGFKVSFEKRFFNVLNTSIQYFQTETQEGVRALTDRIKMSGFLGEFYWQSTQRFSLSGVFNRSLYSDNNKKETMVLAANYSVMLKNPNIILNSYYALEDFEKIYLNSLPYWTPNELTTKSIGLSIMQNVSLWFDIGLSYALTKQQATYAHNMGGNISIHISRYDKLYFLYSKNGSDVYSAKSFTAYYQHRF